MHTIDDDNLITTISKDQTEHNLQYSFFCFGIRAKVPCSTSATSRILLQVRGLRKAVGSSREGARPSRGEAPAGLRLHREQPRAHRGHRNRRQASGKHSQVLLSLRQRGINHIALKNVLLNTSRGLYYKTFRTMENDKFTEQFSP